MLKVSTRMTPFSSFTSQETITKLFKAETEKQREQAEKQREQAENAIKKQREQAENANGKPPVKKQSAGELRLIKDISELNLPKKCSISFPNGKNDLMNFEINILPDEGYYMGGLFTFYFSISPLYPYEAPKVKCMTEEPIHVDPLNHVAAAKLRDDPTMFGYNVRRGMIGGLVEDVFFAPSMANLKGF